MGNTFKAVCLLAPLLLDVGSSQAMPTSTNGLLGSEFSAEVQFQPVATSERFAVSFLATAIVDENQVEFPSLGALEISNNPLNLLVVDVAIDVGKDFIEIDFDNAGSGTFASGFFNGYEFIFDDLVAVDIIDAVIDPISNLAALTPESLNFSGNSLSFSVDGGPYNPSSFVRINLEAARIPPIVRVPEPPSIVLAVIGMLLLGFAVRISAQRSKSS